MKKQKFEIFDLEIIWQADEEIIEAVRDILESITNTDNRLFGDELTDMVVWRLDLRKENRQSVKRKVRDAIHSLRKEGKWILSKGGKGGGYWVTTSRRELVDFLNREFRKKALDMLHTASMMETNCPEQLKMFEDLF